MVAKGQLYMPGVSFVFLFLMNVCVHEILLLWHYDG